MKILIIEDETAAVQNVKRLLQQHLPEATVVGVLPSVQLATSWFQTNPQPDLVLMDIELTDGRSFEILQHVQVDADVIFTTAYDDYVLQAFEFNSIDYLLKPISEHKFALAVQKFRQRLTRRVSLEQISLLLNQQQPQAGQYKKRFLVKQGNRLLSIKQEQVAFFFRDDYVFLVTKQGIKFPLNQTLEELEDSIDPALFFRLNRKYLAHIDAISQMEGYGKSRLRIELHPSHDESIIISQEKSRLFKLWLEQAY